jgi:hypothetical protein
MLGVLVDRLVLGASAVVVMLVWRELQTRAVVAVVIAQRGDHQVVQALLFYPYPLHNTAAQLQAHQQSRQVVRIRLLHSMHLARTQHDY